MGQRCAHQEIDRFSQLTSAVYVNTTVVTIWKPTLETAIPRAGPDQCVRLWMQTPSRISPAGVRIAPGKIANKATRKHFASETADGQRQADQHANLIWREAVQRREDGWAAQDEDDATLSQRHGQVQRW